jgi:hypothetical protein
MLLIFSFCFVNWLMSISSSNVTRTPVISDESCFDTGSSYYYICLFWGRKRNEKLSKLLIKKINQFLWGGWSHKCMHYALAKCPGILTRTNLVFLKFSFDPFRSVGAFKQFNLFRVAKFRPFVVFSMFYDRYIKKKKFF